MEINKLEILIRAIELGSLSKAAAEFMYTPSAASHILDGIENEIGTKFIKRTHTGIRVEDGCEQIIENLKKIVNIDKQTKRLAQDININKKGTLTIATYASLLKEVLANIIKEFNKEYQYINIDIMVTDDIQKNYEEGKADIIFGDKIENEDAVWEELIIDPFVAVVPENYPAETNSIKRGELYKRTFINVKEKRISSYLDENKSCKTINVDSHDDSSVIHMVREGIGIAILPRLSVRKTSGVKYLNLDPGLDRILGLSYRKNLFNNKSELYEFVKFMKKFDFSEFNI